MFEAISLNAMNWGCSDLTACIGNRFLQNIVQSVQEETGVWAHSRADPWSGVFMDRFDGAGTQCG
jgi:hypothetical protein